MTANKRIAFHPSLPSPCIVLVVLLATGPSAISQANTTPARKTDHAQHADQYISQSVPDIRSAIKNAIEALPNRCGTIEIGAGRYKYSSTIVKPRCVIIRGQ